MTDRISGYIITLDHNIREDDAEPIFSAISQIRGVLRVSKIVADHNTHIAETRVKHELVEKILTILMQLDD